MRMIDADALGKAIRSWKSKLKPWTFVKDKVECTALEHFLALLDNSPTIEAEPVVHCRECKHWGMRKHATLKKNEVYYCKMVDGITYGRSYCWYGEKRGSKEGAENGCQD